MVPDPNIAGWRAGNDGSGPMIRIRRRDLSDFGRIDKIPRVATVAKRRPESVPVTLRQLRYFRALVEHGSFSRAAESVYVSQPALSLQIRELEAVLGGPLVERESRGVLLTRLGKEVHEQSLRVLDETLLLETMGKQYEVGSLRIALGIVSSLAPISFRA